MRFFFFFSFFFGDEWCWLKASKHFGGRRVRQTLVREVKTKRQKLNVNKYLFKNIAYRWKEQTNKFHFQIELDVSMFSCAFVGRWENHTLPSHRCNRWKSAGLSGWENFFFYSLVWFGIDTFRFVQQQQQSDGLFSVIFHLIFGQNCLYTFNTHRFELKFNFRSVDWSTTC